MIEDAIDGEWNVLSLQKGPWSGRWDILSSTGRMRVHAVYDGCWAFAPGLVDEDDELPAWPVSLENSPMNAYSVQLTIDVPSDAYLVMVEK